MKIFKYPVLTENANQTEFVIKMPTGANILSFQTKNNEPYIWAEVGSDSSQQESRSFKLVGTGIDFERKQSDRYIATTQCGNFVWHLYETGA